jgi:hypothetical protein
MQSLLVGQFVGNVNPHLASWVLYRFLWNERPKQLTAYQGFLMDGEAPNDAWRHAFPEWDIISGKAHGLDSPVLHHQRNGRGLKWEVKLGKVDHTFTPRPASAGDVHLALLGLRLLDTNKLIENRVRLEAMEEAAREETGHPVVSAELARLRGVPLLPALRASAAATPADGRGWYLLGLEATEPAERESALRRAVEHWPLGALANAALANQLATTGRAREALPLANRAVDLAPWHPTAVSSLATVAVELGQCKQALLLQARAVEAATTHRVGSLGTDPDKLQGRLAELKKRCAAPAGPAAAATMR